MISNRIYYEFIDCPFRPSGMSLVANPLRNHITMEEWLWLEEAMRTAEIRASAPAKLKGTSFSVSYPRGVSWVRAIPDRATLANLKTRINAITSREVIKTVDWNLHINTSGFPIWATSTIPTETSTVFESKVTRGALFSPVTTEIGCAVSKDNISALEGRAALLTTTTWMDIQAFNVGLSGIDSLFNGTTEWRRNGAAGKSPESDWSSAVACAPFLWHHTTTGVEKHTAKFYYRISYTDTDVGTVDYTYSREPVRMYYNFPSTPFHYGKDGDSGVTDSFVQMRLVMGCWQDSIWKIRVNGSSVWDVVAGASGNFAAYRFGGGIENQIGDTNIRFIDGCISVKSIGDQVVDYLKLENRTQYDPRVNVGTITEKKRIGSAWYVAPLWAIVYWSPSGRILD